MANLRVCSRCKSNIDISYFGMSRKKEPYKTCNNCRPGFKKENKITINHYEIIDKELRNEYEKETGVNSEDFSYKDFTFQEQVDRKAKMLLFWDKHRPTIDIGENDPYKIAKLMYVSDMRVKTLNNIATCSDELQNAICKRYSELSNEAVQQ